MEIDADTSPEKPGFEEHERLMRRFAAWLNRALKDEPPPEGLTAELLSALRDGEELSPLNGTEGGAGQETESGADRGCDLYSLWSAMTTLAQEVRVQGRLFKRLNETLTGSVQNRDTLVEETPAAEAARAEAPPCELAANGQPRSQAPRKQDIDVLLDLRDRLERGIASARAVAGELAPTRLPRLARWLGVGGGYARHAQEVFTALLHGYTLTLDRLDEALVACGVDRIACRNRLFDPQRMTAIDIEETGAVPEGTVVEVYRDGYEWNGQVYRAAQVKVARNMGAESNER